MSCTCTCVAVGLRVGGVKEQGDSRTWRQPALWRGALANCPGQLEQRCPCLAWSSPSGALGSKQSQTKLTNQTIKTTIKQVLLISATYNQDLSSPVFFFFCIILFFFQNFQCRLQTKKTRQHAFFSPTILSSFSHFLMSVWS